MKQFRYLPRMQLEQLEKLISSKKSMLTIATYDQNWTKSKKKARILMGLNLNELYFRQKHLNFDWMFIFEINYQYCLPKSIVLAVTLLRIYLTKKIPVIAIRQIVPHESISIGDKFNNFCGKGQ